MSIEKKRGNAAWGPSTRAIHLGYDPMEHEGAVTPPVYMTSTYTFETAEAGGDIFRGDRVGYVYGRTKNPTQALLEERVASLEGGEAAVAFASGMGAITTTFWSLMQAGDRVVVDETLYGSSFAFFARGISRFGVEVVVADLADLDTAATTIPGARAVYFETPANPNMRVIDIAAVAEIAHASDALLIVDNTFCSPILQRPIEHGADLVVHSATKFLGGHGDLLGGLLVGPAETLKTVRTQGLRFMTGATMAPMNAFLILRGLKTLALRMRQHSQSAQAVAELLAGHPKVAWVAYPGLPDFSERALARRQMDGMGGLISFELKGGMAAGMAMMNALSMVTRAVSLGDAETLIQHPASMTHSTYTEEERAAHGIGDGLVRLSVGLEDTADILADLEAALDAVAG